MKGKGRPATKPAKLKDGFYIEILNKGQKGNGIRIRLNTKKEMEEAAVKYTSTKDVVILGECKNEEWLK